MLRIKELDITFTFCGLDQGFHFSGTKFPFWKWNDPEICCVSQNSGLIPDQMETGMFTVYVTLSGNFSGWKPENFQFPFYKLEIFPVYIS